MVFGLSEGADGPFSQEGLNPILSGGAQMEILAMTNLMIPSPRLASQNKPEDRLDSWKEIASYLRRQVRTAQMWEKTEGLPVRRHFHSKIGTVYAYKPEIDQWWIGRCSRLQGLPITESPSASDYCRSRALTKIKLGIVAFEAAHSDPRSEMFVGGLSEELLTVLGGLCSHELTIISLSSQTVHRSDEAAVSEKFECEVGVDFVLHGNVQCSTDRIRIYTHLIQANDKSTVWSKRYELEAGEMFSMQNEIASRIAQSLRLELT